MTLSKRFQLVLRRTLAVCNARYTQIRALQQVNACDLHSFHSTPEEFLLTYGSNLTPQLVSSFVTEQGDPELAYQLFSLARQHNGYKHTDEAYSAMISTLCRGKHFDLLEKLLIDMKAENCFVSESTFSFMLKAMSEEGMIKESLSLFNRMADFGCKPTSTTYKCVLNSLVNVGNLDEAMWVYTKMRDANVYPDSILVGMLTNGLCKANKVDKALKLVESVVEIPGSVDSLTINGVVGCVCKAGRPSDARKFLENVKGFDVAPNVTTYNKLMDGFCRLNEVDEAMRLLEEMLKNSIKPNAVTLNTLLTGLFKQSKIDEALQLFGRMDSTVEADATTFNIIVNVLCRKNRFIEACTFVSEMNRKNLTPTTHTYTAIVSGLFKLGKVDGACQILGDMKEVGVIADTMFYNELINGLCKANRVDDARCMLVQMTENGCHPSEYTFSSIIHGLCKANRVLEAMEFGQDIVKRGCDMDIICWNPVLEGLCRSSKTEEALKLLDVLSERGCMPVRSTFNCMVKGLCVAKKLDDVRKFLVDMKKNGIDRDMATYAALIDGKAHYVSGTVDLFRPLLGGNVVLQLGRYISLVVGLFHAGEIEFALKVFKEMQRVGCTPSTATFNAFIDGLFKSNKLNEAQEFFRNMREYGCAPDKFTYTVLMHGLCNAGDYDAVDLVYEEMQAEGCQPDDVVYGVLLNGFSHGGKFKEMYGVLDDMRLQGCRPNEKVLRNLFQNLCHKDIKRVSKYIKEAFGISYAPDVSEFTKPVRDEGRDIKSSMQTSLFNVQDEENTQPAPDVENLVTDMDEENTRRVRIPCNKGSVKVSDGRPQQAHKSIKAERQRGISKPSLSRVKSQEVMSGPRHSVRTSSSKVPKKGKTQIHQAHESNKSVEVRRQKGTKSSRSSAIMGYLKVSEEENSQQAGEVKKRAVGDVGQEVAKRPRASYKTQLSKEGKVYEERKGTGSSTKVRRAQTGETQKIKQKQKKPRKE